MLSDFGISYLFTLVSTDQAPVACLFIVCGREMRELGGEGATDGFSLFKDC